MSHVTHLRGLQIFNEVAKTLNLTHAAERLTVTQGAVSHQIRILEKSIGYQLVKRHASGVVLTDKGQRLFAATNPAFELLATGVTEVSRQVHKKSLTISLPTALATKWLVPRLPRFKKLHQNLTLFLDTTDELVDFEKSEVDVAIRFAIPETGNYFSQKIRDETLIAVVSPRLVSKLGNEVSQLSIHAFPILEDAFDSKWETWARMSGQRESPALVPTVRYTDSAVMISAAIDGQGVALARRVMVEDDLAQGRLQMFDDTEVPLDRAMLFLCRHHERNEPRIAALRKWLLSLS